MRAILNPEGRSRADNRLQDAARVKREPGDQLTAGDADGNPIGTRFS
jgi:hypothetical protein